jgi:hypothetical protein
VWARGDGLPNEKITLYKFFFISKTTIEKSIIGTQNPLQQMAGEFKKNQVPIVTILTYKPSLW